MDKVFVIWQCAPFASPLALPDFSLLIEAGNVSPCELLLQFDSDALALRMQLQHEGQ